jgi:hypothetical protein
MCNTNERMPLTENPDSIRVGVFSARIAGSKPGSVPHSLTRCAVAAISLCSGVLYAPPAEYARSGPTRLAGRCGLPRPMLPWNRVSSYLTVSPLPALLSEPLAVCFLLRWRATRVGTDFPPIVAVACPDFPLVSQRPPCRDTSIATISLSLEFLQV